MTEKREGLGRPGMLCREAPTLYLAHSPSAPGTNCLVGRNGVPRIERGMPMLVSFYYVKGFMRERGRYAVDKWVLDSGAYSAFASGAKIDLAEYTEFCLEVLSTDPDLVEVYSLDVIGGSEWRKTLDNMERMWAAGVPAIPTYHLGEPWEMLEIIRRDYPGKIAIGGAACAKGRAKLDQARQVFARAWPARIHGFAFGGKAAIRTLPFHSVDATNWQISPLRYGNWHITPDVLRKFSNIGRISQRGSRQDLSSEVARYGELQRWARFRWRREMALLERECAPWPPPRSVRGVEHAQGVERASGAGGP